jgi:general secretion pathway protein M
MADQDTQMKLWLAHAQQYFAAFWAQRDARERKLLLVSAAVIAAALYYLLLIAPPLSGREQLTKNLPALREQVAQMQALSGEAAGLAEKTDASVAAMTKETLNATLAAHGLKAQSTSVTGGIAQIQLSGVSFSRTLEWLIELQKTARVSVSDTKISPLSQPDQIDAIFTLHQSGQP